MGILEAFKLCLSFDSSGGAFDCQSPILSDSHLTFLTAAEAQSRRSYFIPALAVSKSPDGVDKFLQEQFGVGDATQYSHVGWCWRSDGRA